MATFKEIRRNTQSTAREMSQLTGVPYDLVINIIHYSRSLAHPSTPNHIDDAVFTAQMGIRFGITSHQHIKFMIDALIINHAKYIEMKDYVRLICLFASDKLDLKIDYVFRVYSSKRDCIDRKALVYLLKPSIMYTAEDTDPDEALNELVGVVMKNFDVNSDGRISLEEYRECVKKDILYMQLLGQVLPKSEDLYKFINILKVRNPLEVTKYFENERVGCLAEPIPRKDQLIQSLFSVTLDMP